VKLTHIRLAGFKSFAEPTVIVTPGQRIAVVGPNGCGKSNLIDAVRWVLGESRASNLRGEAMQDVIFSGTSQRRALGRASVELVFEQDGQGNSPWSVYRELSVKRVMTREGDSTYFINNQSVRRKDVTDLFLGSGLGARSFAIIEQGMISKIIESKPEEMRTLLEDAAGIARYRERRKESESRLQSAREQLQRLSDVRSEWAGQYEKLEVQARQARQFMALQERKAEREAALLMCTAQREADHLKEAEAALIELEVRRDAAQQACQTTQDAAQRARDRYDALQLQLRESQQAQAQVQVERTRRQSAVREAQQQYAALEEERVRLEAQQRQWSIEWQMHQETQPSIEAQQMALQDAVAEALEKEAEAREALLTADSAFHLQQKQWSEHQQRLSHVEQQRQTTKVRDEHIQKRLVQLGAEEGRAQQSLSAVPKVDAGSRQALLDREAQAEEALKAAQLQLEQAESTLLEQRAMYEAAQSDIQTQRALMHSQKARLEALRVLEKEKSKSDWADEWAEQPSFWSVLTVEPGWERAIEVVLRERFHARSGEFNADTSLHWGGVLWSEERAKAFDQSKKATISKAVSKQMVPVWTKVKATTEEADAALMLWCSDVIAAPSLEEALLWQREGQLVNLRAVTPDGTWVDAVSVQSFVRGDDHHAVLALKAEREALEVAFSTQSETLQADEIALHECKNRLEHAEPALKTARQLAAHSQEQWHQINAERRVQEERVQRNEQQILELTAHRKHIAQQREHEEQDREELKFQSQELEIQHEALMHEREQIRSARNEADVMVSKARTALSEIQQKTRLMQQDLVRAEGAQRQWEDKKNWLTQQRESWVAQERTLEERIKQCQAQPLDVLKAALEEADSSVEDALQKLSVLEKELQHVQGVWKESDEARLKADRQLQTYQTQREALVLAVERARVTWAHTQESMLESGIDSERLSELAKEGADLLQESIKGLNTEISTLGPVNLVALNEVEGAKSRLDELESQHSDVQEAVLTLDEAIRRLDGESRQRLRQALEALNQALAVHFAAMFGGGTAQLVPTGTDLLSAGIQLWAEPPGKRNVSLHLLSGGEKALTAISLMLALFELNPAPFCLLDEVDAPLDDVNTARLAKMLVQLSGRVQCVYISHHRLTMEVAEQLVGVTMPEAGVSRVVEVDMQSALAWAGTQKKKGVEAHG